MEAKQTFQQHLDALFTQVTPSRAAYELQEELLANSLERYGDLVGKGMPEAEAVQNVLHHIGNVDELLLALPHEDETANSKWNDTQRGRSALIVAVSIGIYIFAGCLFLIGTFLSDVFGDTVTGVCFIASLLICIIPTCMLVYNAKRWPEYSKKDNTMVEEFKAYSSSSGRQRSIRGAISSTIWSLCLVSYFLVSFLSGAWHITWVLFLVAACLEAITSLTFAVKGLR